MVSLTNNQNLIFFGLLIFLNLITFIRCLENNSKENIELIKNEESRLRSLLSGASFNSFTIQSGEQDNAELKFGSENSFYSFVTRGKQKDFLISHLQKPILSINKDNEVMIFAKALKAEKGISFNGELKFRGVPLCRLFYDEDFSQESLPGWSKTDITSCGGVRMLGGYCKFAGGEVQKTYEKLPDHNNIRIQATFHFIDAWDTEAGFMRINNGKDKAMEYIWTERYSAFIGSNGINVCGGRWPEGKFSSPIDVTIPHKDSSIKLGFGSTLEQDACDESFGVSGIRIYVK